MWLFCFFLLVVWTGYSLIVKIPLGWSKYQKKKQFLKQYCCSAITKLVNICECLFSSIGLHAIHISY